MLAKKFIGKPYAGKPHVRFDEGVGRVIILPSPLYSTVKYEVTWAKKNLRKFNSGDFLFLQEAIISF